MRRLPGLWAFALCCAALAPMAAPARAADEVASPLNLIPKQADAVVVVDRPRRVVDVLRALEPMQQLAQFGAVQEQLRGTNFRRFLQLVQYYERELGSPWPELIDQLAGGGIALAIKFEGDNSPVLAVMRATDEAKLARTTELFVGVITDELARQEGKAKPQTRSYRERTIHQLDDKAFLAQVGTALIFSNREAAMHAAIDLHINGAHESVARRPGWSGVREQIPADALAWMWADLAKLQQLDNYKDIYEYPKADATQLLFFGGMTDVVGKSPSVIGWLVPEKGSMVARIKLGAGRNATPPDIALHYPPEGKAGSLPLLEPKDVLFSSSFYLDLATYWNERERLLQPGALKELENAEKQLGRFLAGRKLSEILQGSGMYHRVVVAQQRDTGYKTKPNVPQPAFATVTSMRSPDFGQAMNGILRATALVLGAGVKLKLVEEEIDGIKLVGYRFPENGKFNGDPENNRFNFSPCFAVVGDQFFAASTIELGRELVELLQKPSKQPRIHASAQTQFYGAGGVALLRNVREQIVTQSVLDNAISVEAAEKETQQLLNFVQKLGVVNAKFDFQAKQFLFELRWQYQP